MAQTPLGLSYPEPGDHTRLWEHFQTLAEDVDGLAASAVGQLYVSGDRTNVSAETKMNCAVTLLGGGMTAANSALVVPRDGHYRISVSQRFNTGGAVILVKQNDTTNLIIARLSNSAGNETLSATVLRSLQAGDTVSFWLSGMGGTLYGNATESCLAVELVCPT